MTDAAARLMTVAEFLTWDDGTDTRYELIDGMPVAMAPVAPGHSVIVANATYELKSKLQHAALEFEAVRVTIPLAAVYADSGV